MATQAILGLFDDASLAADAGDALKASGVAEADYQFLTDIPYPEGAFGEPMERHSLFIWPLIGGALGIIVALVVTGMTPMATLMITGPKPILAMPPLAVMCFASAMLGAILFTVIGLMTSLRTRLPSGVADDRIADGLIGVVVNAGAAQEPQVTEILNHAGALDVTSNRA
jgi:hypothetical protein